MTRRVVRALEPRAAHTGGYGAPVTAIQDIPVSTIDGQAASLADHAGKVLLVVNVASKCGLTPQYTALEALYESKRDDGFAVLGFPANNFGAQEPGSNEEIAEFCSLTYDVKFPLFAILAEVFVEKPTAEWCEILRAAGQRYAPVRNYAEVAADPQVWENGYLAEADGGRVVGTPIRLSDTPARVGTPAPDLGADTFEVLLAAGYTDAELADLLAAGAI